MRKPTTVEWIRGLAWFGVLATLALSGTIFSPDFAVLLTSLYLVLAGKPFALGLCRAADLVILFGFYPFLNQILLSLLGVQVPLVALGVTVVLLGLFKAQRFHTKAPRFRQAEYWGGLATLHLSGALLGMVPYLALNTGRAYSLWFAFGILVNIVLAIFPEAGTAFSAVMTSETLGHGTVSDFSSPPVSPTRSTSSSRRRGKLLSFKWVQIILDLFSLEGK